MNLYTAQQTRQLDTLVTTRHKISSYELMCRAGEAAYRLLKKKWPKAKTVLVVCGLGNNAGDGFVVARLAHKDRKQVFVQCLGDPENLAGAARQALEKCRDPCFATNMPGGIFGAMRRGGSVKLLFSTNPPKADSANLRALRRKNSELARTPMGGISRQFLKDADVIVDAIFGTGLSKNVEGDFAKVIQEINSSGNPLLSLDIPSGLSADTGAVLGCAVKASAVITFIGRKQGLYTADGPDHSGEIYFDDLTIPQKIFDQVNASAQLLDFDQEIKKIPKRKKNSHKGDFGRVLVVGGDEGMVGATFLAGEAALRAGAGLVTLCVKDSPGFDKRQERPEFIIHSSEKLESLLKEATVIAVGPGLGQSAWSKKIFQKCLQTKKPLVVDADALNLLAKSPTKKQNWILTPHPGEASRLLNRKDVQKNRFSVVREIQKKYGGVVVLKGCGTLICEDEKKPVWVCADGNPYMATAGMGDVLTGVIAALIGQGLSLRDAVCLGVCLHARAGDLVAKKSAHGLIASDLFSVLQKLINKSF